MSRNDSGAYQNEDAFMYYNMETINSQLTPQPAEITNQLEAYLLPRISQNSLNLAVARLKVPLGSIPILPEIPANWEVGLTFNGKTALMKVLDAQSSAPTPSGGFWGVVSTASYSGITTVNNNVSNNYSDQSMPSSNQPIIAANNGTYTAVSNLGSNIVQLYAWDPSPPNAVVEGPTITLPAGNIVMSIATDSQYGSSAGNIYIASVTSLTSASPITIWESVFTASPPSFAAPTVFATFPYTINLTNYTRYPQLSVYFVGTTMYLTLPRGDGDIYCSTFTGATYSHFSIMDTPVNSHYYSVTQAQPTYIDASTSWLNILASLHLENEVLDTLWYDDLTAPFPPGPGVPGGAFYIRNALHYHENTNNYAIFNAGDPWQGQWVGIYMSEVTPIIVTAYADSHLANNTNNVVMYYNNNIINGPMPIFANETYGTIWGFENLSPTPGQTTALRKTTRINAGANPATRISLAVDACVNFSTVINLVNELLEPTNPITAADLNLHIGLNRLLLASQNNVYSVSGDVAIDLCICTMRSDNIVACAQNCSLSWSINGASYGQSSSGIKVDTSTELSGMIAAINQVTLVPTPAAQRLAISVLLPDFNFIWGPEAPFCIINHIGGATTGYANPNNRQTHIAFGASAINQAFPINFRGSQGIAFAEWNANLNSYQMVPWTHYPGYPGGVFPSSWNPGVIPVIWNPSNATAIPNMFTNIGCTPVITEVSNQVGLRRQTATNTADYTDYPFIIVSKFFYAEGPMPAKDPQWDGSSADVTVMNIAVYTNSSTFDPFDIVFNEQHTLKSSENIIIYFNDTDDNVNNFGMVAISVPSPGVWSLHTLTWTLATNQTHVRAGTADVTTDGAIVATGPGAALLTGCTYLMHDQPPRPTDADPVTRGPPTLIGVTHIATEIFTGITTWFYAIVCNATMTTTPVTITPITIVNGPSANYKSIKSLNYLGTTQEDYVIATREAFTTADAKHDLYQITRTAGVPSTFIYMATFDNNLDVSDQPGGWSTIMHFINPVAPAMLRKSIQSPPLITAPLLGSDPNYMSITSSRQSPFTIYATAGTTFPVASPVVSAPINEYDPTTSSWITRGILRHAYDDGQKPHCVFATNYLPPPVAPTTPAMLVRYGYGGPVNPTPTTGQPVNFASDNINTLLSNAETLTLCDQTGTFTPYNATTYAASTPTTSSTAASAYYINISPDPAYILPTPAAPVVIYSYDQILTLVNIAFTNCVLRLGTKDNALPAGQPIMIFNPATKLFSVNIPADYANLVQVSFSAGMQSIFHMPSSVSSILTDAAITDLFYVISETSGTANGSSVQVTQEFSSMSHLMDLDLIRVNTNIPANGDVNSNTTVNAITDFTPDPDGLSPSSTLVYLPNGFYREYAIRGMAALRSIDVSIWYRSRTGKTQRLMINPGESWSIKLVFIRR